MTTHNIFKGDARKLPLKDLSVDMILTDPPYNISRDETVIFRGKNMKYKGINFTSDFGEWDHFKDEDEYIKFIHDWTNECVRVLKNGGHMVTFFDMYRMNYLLNIPNMITRQFIFWHKTNPVPRGAMIDFMQSVEVMIWLTKEPKSGSTFNYKNGQQHNMIDTPIPGHTTKEDGDRCHPTQKPVKVARILISYLSNKGDTILDPFCGSGWANIAAKKLGRNSIGCDIRQKCVDDTIRRINNVYEITSINYKQSGLRI